MASPKMVRFFITFDFQKQLKFMSVPKNNPAEISKASEDLINAAKAGEPGNPGTNAEPSSTIPGVPNGPGPNVLTPGQPGAPLTPEPNQPGATLTAPSQEPTPTPAQVSSVPPTQAGIVRQQGRAASFNLEGINQDVKGISTEQLHSIKIVVDGELAFRQPEQQKQTMAAFNYGGEIIEAEKDGQKTTFTKASWDQLPENKKGWKEVVKTPPEVQALKK